MFAVFTRNSEFKHAERVIRSPLTLSVPAVLVILRQPPQVVSEQHLIARNPLNRLQHVVLQGQISTHLLTLRNHTHTHT